MTSNFMVGMGTGFVIGAFVSTILCWWWLENYTTEQDQKKAAFGDIRYKEGFRDGEATGIQTGHVDGWQDGWEAKEAQVEYQKRQELKAGERTDHE